LYKKLFSGIQIKSTVSPVRTFEVLLLLLQTTNENRMK
jgi:hypothetical protein